MSLKDLKDRWEKIAQIDPLWAVCTDPLKKGGKWQINDLFAQGEKEIRTVLGHISSLGLSIDRAGIALDFGCGVGRLTQSLAERFRFCYGIDISPTMIRLANQYNKSKPKCKYLVNDAERVSSFKNDFFSFIYSSITLQHMQTKLAKNYLKEFLRVLRPGGILVFNLPSKDKRNLSMMERFRSGLILRTRIKLLLRSTGLFRNITVNEQLMQMHCLPERKVRAVIEKSKGRVIDIQTTNTASPDFNGNLLYLKEEPGNGIISKQYMVTKPNKRKLQ